MISTYINGRKVTVGDAIQIREVQSLSLVICKIFDVGGEVVLSLEVGDKTFTIPASKLHIH